MLVPFFIMLREGIEAALIVGIVASYLARTGRREWMPALWVGVMLACGASLLVGALLSVVNHELPQRAQELFEACIGVIAVGLLTSMVFWMRKASRFIKGELQSGVDAALAGTNQGVALVGLAFFAVVREGLESVFFLLAVFQQSLSAGAPLGAMLGLVVACAVAFGIYVLGMRLDLRAFFRWTGAFILFVAAGLLANAVRALHEAGIWNGLQQTVYDISGALPTDSAFGSVLSGLLGYQDTATLGEVLTYLAFLIPALLLFFFGASMRPQLGGARP